MMRFVVLAGMAGIVLTLRGSDYLADAKALAVRQIAWARFE
jgi:hypothetical protein